MNVLHLLLAVLAGIAAACQGAANAGLAARITLAPALVVNTTVVLLGTLCLWLAQGARTSFVSAGTPWHLYLGGVCGFAIIACAAFVFPKVGAGMAIALMVLGQGLAALAIDHWGLFGMPRSEATPSRALGVLCLLAGTLLLRR